MKKKNAFTLIELLAIIVILAIIAVITVPIILNIIENSKRGAAIDSAYSYRDAINKFYVSKMLDDNGYIIEDGEHDAISYINEGLEVSGEKPSAGWVIIENGGVTDFSIKIGDYVVTYNSNTNTTEAEKSKEIPLTPTQTKAQTYLTSLKQSKPNETDIFNIPIEGVQNSDVTSGWVSLLNGEVIGYSLQIEDKTTSLSSKNASIEEIVKYLATTYLNELTTPSSETTVNITESGKLKGGFIEYKSNNSKIEINDYSLKYEIDGVTKYANYIELESGKTLIIEDTKKNRPSNITFISGDKNTQYSEVKIKNEEFYVLIPENSNGITTLLAKNCLINTSESTWRQITGSEKCTTKKFSGSNYWNEKVGPDQDYPEQYCTNSSQTGCAYVYDAKNGDSNYIKTIVDLYTDSLSEAATGRLMRVEEANNLDSTIRKISNYYWLGSAYSYKNIWNVNSGGDLSNYNYSNVNGGLNIRPVIEISTSEIQ